MFTSTFSIVSQGAHSSLFSQEELSNILQIYGQKVIDNIWQDYTIICAEGKTSFVVLDTTPTGQTDICSITVQENDNGPKAYHAKKDGYPLITTSFETALDFFQSNSSPKRLTPPLKLI